MFLLKFFETWGDFIGLIVDGKDDLFDADFSGCLDLMLDHWVVGEGDDWFGAGEGEGAESGAVTSDENEGFHLMDYYYWVGIRGEYKGRGTENSVMWNSKILKINWEFRMWSVGLRVAFWEMLSLMDWVASTEKRKISKNIFLKIINT